MTRPQSPPPSKLKALQTKGQLLELPEEACQQACVDQYLRTVAAGTPCVLLCPTETLQKFQEVLSGCFEYAGSRRASQWAWVDLGPVAQRQWKHLDPNFYRVNQGHLYGGPQITAGPEAIIRSGPEGAQATVVVYEPVHLLDTRHQYCAKAYENWKELMAQEHPVYLYTQDVQQLEDRLEELKEEVVAEKEWYDQLDREQYQDYEIEATHEYLH